MWRVNGRGVRRRRRLRSELERLWFNIYCPTCLSLSLLVFVSITCIFSARDYYLLQNHRRHENQNNGQAAFLDDCPPLDSQPDEFHSTTPT